MIKKLELDDVMSRVEQAQALSEKLSTLMDADKDNVIALTSNAWEHYGTYPKGSLAMTTIVGSCVQVMLNCAQQMAEANPQPDMDEEEAFQLFAATFAIIMTNMSRGRTEKVVQQ